jgi:hypothetical protein
MPSLGYLSDGLGFQRYLFVAFCPLSDHRLRELPHQPIILHRRRRGRPGPGTRPAVTAWLSSRELPLAADVPVQAEKIRAQISSPDRTAVDAFFGGASPSDASVSLRRTPTDRGQVPLANSPSVSLHFEPGVLPSSGLFP